MALEAKGQGGRIRTPHVIDRDRPKRGTACSPEEEQQLRDAYAAHKPIREIAAHHGRTPGAITSRLQKVGLIENPAANRPTGDPPEPSPTPGPIRPFSPAETGVPRRPTPRPSPELTQQEKDDLPF